MNNFLAWIRKTPDRRPRGRLGTPESTVPNGLPRGGRKWKTGAVSHRRNRLEALTGATRATADAVGQPSGPRSSSAAIGSHWPTPGRSQRRFGLQIELQLARI